ncbi:MAG: aldehyde dehydrogenase family protein [Planctomycetota bacterium]|jgi:1-pyrroline-5-carboxylate dehydrogenase
MNGEPLTDFTRDENRRAMAHTIAQVAEALGEAYPNLIGGERVTVEKTFESVDPSEPSVVVGVLPDGDAEHAARAVAAAEAAAGSWSRVAAEERAATLERAAEILRYSRLEFAARLCFEAGMTWTEADAEVASAIDVLMVHARRACELDVPPSGARSAAGSWRAPLGSVAALCSSCIALADTLVLEPARETAVVAWKFVEAVEEAGLPAGVLNLVTGPGPRADASGQPPAWGAPRDKGPREIADAAVENAFRFAGQASLVTGLILPAATYDAVLARVVERTEALCLGPAIDFEADVGPMISADAARATNDVVAAARRDGRILCGGEPYGGGGYFVPPTVIAGARPPDVRGPLLYVATENS